MGVEVTKDKAVIVLVEKFGKIRGVARGAGGSRRDVNIKDISRRSIETCPDAVNFKDRIGAEARKVYGGKVDGMVDKEN